MFQRFIIKPITWNNVVVFVSALYIVSIILFSYSAELSVYSQLIFLLLGGCVFLKLLFENRLPVSPLYLFLTLFLSWCALSTLWAADPPTHLVRLKTLLQLSLISIIYFIIYREEENLQKFIPAFLLGGYAMCFYSLYLYGGWSSFIAMMGEERLGTEVNQANVFGYFASLTVLFSFYLAFYKGRISFYVLLGLPLVMSLSSGSKKAAIMVLMGILLLIFLKNRNKKMIRTGVYIILIGGGLYFILRLPMFAVITERMQFLLNFFSGAGQVDSSTLKRQHFIEAGMQLFSQKPGIGYGLNSFAYITNYPHYSHNNYVEMLINGGIVGVILYYLFIFYPLLKLFKKTMNSDSLSTLFFILLCIGLVYDIGAVTYYNKFQYIIFGVCFACLYRNQRQAYTKAAIE